jgi:hypothetical protein
MAKVETGIKFERASIGFRGATPEGTRELNDPQREDLIDLFLASEDLGVQNPGESAKAYGARMRAKAEEMLVTAGTISPKIPE